MANKPCCLSGYHCAICHHLPSIINHFYHPWIRRGHSGFNLWEFFPSHLPLPGYMCDSQQTCYCSKCLYKWHSPGPPTALMPQPHGKIQVARIHYTMNMGNDRIVFPFYFQKCWPLPWAHSCGSHTTIPRFKPVLLSYIPGCLLRVPKTRMNLAYYVFYLCPTFWA